jgi:predicted transcriptional regulator/DNA-binding XRE family transcriptional regulator
MVKVTSKVVKAIRTGDGELGRVLGNSLRSLRAMAGLTQKDLADRLSIGQAAISKIERRGEVQLSSLQKYTEALGATLHVEAVFNAGACRALQNSGRLAYKLKDGEQLAFPLLGFIGEESKRDVVLSIHPTYSDRILDGSKTIELRRRFPVSASNGTTAYIYSTSPVRALVGQAKIETVVRLPLKGLWKAYGEMAQITRRDFDSYFSGTTEGFALKIANARAFAHPLDLSELRKRFGFKPPQSFLYATPSLRMALQNEYPNLSD